MELSEKMQNIYIEKDVTLDQHLKEIVKRMIECDEKNPFHTFEQYSEDIRRERREGKERKERNGGKERLMYDCSEEMKEMCDRLRSFLKIEVQEEKKEKAEDAEGEEEEENNEVLNMG